MSKRLKILVSGDVDGNFDQLFSRIKSIQKKSGAFDLLLCVGDFFGNNKDEWKKYTTGEKKVPIPVLILGPNKPEHVEYYGNSKGGDLCDNVTYLGKKGLYTGSSGLQLAYLSGMESDIVSDSTNFNAVDIMSLTSPVVNDTKFKGVDILITSQWPKGVEKYGTALTELDTQSCGSESVSQLAIVLKPRYHFCGLQGVHYERQPYRNHKVLAESARHVTRFIGLAKVGNTSKKKYLYAFNITPLSSMDSAELTNQPDDVTECPYKQRQFVLQEENKQDKQEQFFYDMKGGGEKRKGEGKDKQNKRQKGERPVPTGPCWFCLGSPQVEKHLVVSVGTETYLALAKGGLVDDHVLILPVGHYQSSVSAPSDVIDEIEKYKLALKKCFKKQGKAVVFFERNYKTQHLQIQVVPIPADCVQEIKDVFMECAESESLELNEIPKHSDIRQIVQVGVPYFYAELPTGEKLYCRISKNFPLQFGSFAWYKLSAEGQWVAQDAILQTVYQFPFGIEDEYREALASPGILNMPERVDWKMCSVDKSREEILASDFKSTFRTYDFNME